MALRNATPSFVRLYLCNVINIVSRIVRDPRSRPARTIALLLVSLVSISIWLSLQKSPHSASPAAPPYKGPRDELMESGEHGFLSLTEASEFCERRRMEPYATRDSRRKVYDMFLINGELDFLEIRLNELDKEVDYFVILESATTFQMNPKPLHLNESLSRFKDFEHKIIYRVLDESGAKKIPKGDTWAHEHFMRNALFNQVLLSLVGQQAPSQGDVLVLGDVDEIPRASALIALRNCAFPTRVTLRTQMYYYSYQWLHRGELWAHPQATYFNGAGNTIRPESLRSGKADLEIYMAGWHCSSCFATMEDLKNKIRSFSHKGYNQPSYLETEWLLYAARHGMDFVLRPGQVYDRIDDNRDIPQYLQREGTRERFKYMVDRDPPNANFQDM